MTTMMPKPMPRPPCTPRDSSFGPATLARQACRGLTAAGKFRHSYVFSVAPINEGGVPRPVLSGRADDAKALCTAGQGPPCHTGGATLNTYRHSFVIRISSFVILLTAFLAAGCFSPRPDHYVLRGRVLDAETGRGLGDARLRLRAAVATGLGPRVFSAYGITAPDGSYELELGEGYAALRLAGRILLEAGKSGYATGGAEIPPPARKQKAYAAPDVVLQRAKPGDERSESPGS